MSSTSGTAGLYLYADDELHQLTHDHTLMAEMVRRGELQPEGGRACTASGTSSQTSSEGTEAGVSVEAHALNVHAGDRLLLCSDGLTEMVADDAITAILKADADPETACTKLVAQANEAGGRDNITVLIVRFDPAESQAPIKVNPFTLCKPPHTGLYI